MHADVVVIGAGLQGSAVALRLAQAGVDVVVLEKSIPGAEASSAAGGILSPGVEAVEPGPFYSLCRASLLRYPAFAAEVERLSGCWVAYRQLGTLEVAFDDRIAHVLAGRAERLAAPCSSPTRRRSTRSSSRARCRSPPSAPARASCAGRCTASSRRTGAPRASSTTPAASTRAPWCSPPVRGRPSCPAAACPRVRCGRCAARSPCSRPCRRCSRASCSASAATSCPGPTGASCAAPRWRTSASSAASPRPASPTCSGSPSRSRRRSRRPASPDGEPVLGAAALPGLFYATGHTRNGILLAPITADAIAAAVLGRPAPLDLAPFSVARLAARPRPRA